MDHFQLRDGELYAEDVPLARIAEEVGTPVYVYSRATLERHARVFREALSGLDNPHIAFALKSNPNLSVIKVLQKQGFGADVVSLGEMNRALAAGVAAEDIIFSGVGKTHREMSEALDAGIGQFNIESEEEGHELALIAERKGLRAPAALRVNPDVDAKTHAKISTGKYDNKFGIPFSDAVAIYAEAASLPGIRVSGVHMHIGSQITDLGPFDQAFTLLSQLVTTLRAAGHDLTHLDLGGGLGVPYRGTNDVPPHPDEYAAVVRRCLGGLGLKLVFEPGRMIAANAGILVACTIYGKRTPTKTFTIVDAAMNDLIRPTLYDAYHDVWPVIEPPAGVDLVEQDVVGPVCESGDYLTETRRLPPFAPGDLMAFMSAGAYGAVMASTYNTRPLVPEVLVNGAEFSIVRPRQTVEELIAMDRIPPWLG